MTCSCGAMSLWYIERCWQLILFISKYYFFYTETTASPQFNWFMHAKRWREYYRRCIMQFNKRYVVGTYLEFIRILLSNFIEKSNEQYLNKFLLKNIEIFFTLQKFWVFFSTYTGSSIQKLHLLHNFQSQFEILNFFKVETALSHFFPVESLKLSPPSGGFISNNSGSIHTFSLHLAVGKMKAPHIRYRQIYLFVFCFVIEIDNSNWMFCIRKKVKHKHTITFIQWVKICSSPIFASNKKKCWIQSLRNTSHHFHRHLVEIFSFFFGIFLAINSKPAKFKLEAIAFLV